MRFSHTEANLLPKNHSYNIAYDNFTNVFGEEGNLILIAVNDSSLFELDNFNAC
jgi:predicted RND superfamily exporter protein